MKQRQKELDKKVAHYRQHLLQYETCRAAVKQCENDLKFNDRKCVLYRDFVNMYNEKGQKVKNLVLVKLTRNDRNTLDVVKLHNFCTQQKWL